MDKIRNHLNYLGLALIGLAFISIIIWPYRSTAPLILFILGMASLVIYIFLNRSSLKQTFKRKSFIYSGNLIVVIVLVLGILSLINYFFARHHHRFDFTESKLHSLSDQSVKLLNNLKNEVNIKCFFLEGNFSRNNMENLMNIYNYHSKKIKYEFIDPDKNPGLVKRYEISEDATTVFESGDKESRITTTTEEDITNAIIKVSREKKKVIYFLEGHGELSIEVTDEKGYSFAKEELEKIGYEVKKLALALSETFPQDCALLVIPGAEKDLFPNELETIRNFLNNRGGRVFFMVDPQTAPGLTPFLSEFGIQLEEDLIVDTVSRLLGGDYFMPVINEYEPHEITEKFRYATFFPFTRSISVTEETPDGITANILAKTSPNSWSERALTASDVAFDKDKDVAGPISLAAVVTIEQKEEEKEEKAAEEKEKASEAEENKEEDTVKEPGRLAVFGDSDFASNRYYNFAGNGNFFLNTVNWLTEEADLISIQPKTSSPRTINLTPSQGRMIFFVSIILLPLAVLITGIFVWVRRRSL